MARYRTKDETDLRWNRIRRTLTREMDTQIQNSREHILNDILADAWDKYAQALETGTKLEIENRYTEFVDHVLRREVNVVIEEEPPPGAAGDVEDRPVQFSELGPEHLAALKRLLGEAA